MILNAKSPSELRAAEIVIVDPKVADYLSFARSTPAGVALCQTAGEALQLASARPLLWVMHAELPDLPGLELHRQLCLLERQASSSSILISEQYEAQLEVAALTAGSLMYRPKPLDFNQLERIWLDLVNRTSHRKAQRQGRALPART